MLQKPRLREHFQVLLVQDRWVLLLSDLEDHVLSARLYPQLLPLLDGLTSTDELVGLLQQWGTPADVWCALWQLERLGCVEEATAAPLPPAGKTPHPEAGRLPFVPITVCALGRVPVDECRAALQSSGFVLDDVAGLPVVLTDSYLSSELDELNARALDAGTAWLLAKPYGPVIWIGPLFRPREGCCWRCLADRLRRNRPFEYHLLHRPGDARPLPRGRDYPETIGRACARLASELAACPEYLTADGLANTIIALDTTDVRRRSHQVVRRPQCPACGNSGLYAVQASAPLSLRSQPKRFTQGGACRIVSPGETLAAYQRLLDPLAGVVQHLEPVSTGQGATLGVYVARYGGDPMHDDCALQDRRLERSSGKGLSDVEARTSSLGEAIERYCGVFQGDEPRIEVSLKELGSAAIHPNRCMQFSETQYRNRQDSNARRSSLEWVPPPLEPECRLDWTPLRSLSREAQRYLPTMFLYSGYPVGPERAYCVSDPSGSAAGNSREEAVLQGLMELIERDSLAIWWYNRIARAAVDLEGIADPYYLSLKERYRSIGRDFWVLDITSDLGIPAFAAVSRRTNSGSEQIVLGFGAHLDPCIGFGRALSEMDQILTLVTAGERDGTLGPRLRTWLREATVVNHAYLAPAPIPASRLQRMPRLATTDIADDVRVCQRLLARHQLEVLVLDQTRPDVRVPVVKVVVPGLRHFRARFAPGRLYTAPLSAGWTDHPLKESQLNPTEFFL